MPNVLLRSLEVELPESQIQAAIAKKFDSPQMKGFRSGSLPPISYLRKKWGDEFLTDILQSLLQVRINKEIAEMRAEVAGGISVEAIWNTWDQPLHYKYLIQFEIYPKFVVQGLDALALPPVQPTTLDDAQLDTFVEIMRRERSPWKSLDRGAQAGDRVVVNFQGTIDGLSFPGGHGNAAKIDLGAGGMLPEFEHALNGAMPDQKLSFPVTFPESYATPFLAGKTAQFEVTVLAVQAIDLLPLDDAFAARFGAASVALMRQAMRENLEQQHREQDQRDISNHLLNQLVAANDIPLPGALISQHLQALQVEMAHNQGRTVEQVAVDDGMIAIARRRSHLNILVRQLVKTERIEVSQAVIEARLARLSAGADVPDAILKNAEVIQQVTAELTQEHVIDWLIARATQNRDTTTS